MSHTLISSLRSQNAFLQAEVERFANGVDTLSQRLANALNRLKPFDPEFVSAEIGEDAATDVPDCTLGAETEASE